MKKIYIQPVIITSLRYEMEKPLCGSTGQRDWNVGLQAGSDYANPKYFNEGYDQSSQSSTITIENDNGNLNSMTKGRGSDWGSIW